MCVRALYACACERFMHVRASALCMCVRALYVCACERFMHACVCARTHTCRRLLVYACKVALAIEWTRNWRVSLTTTLMLTWWMIAFVTSDCTTVSLARFRSTTDLRGPVPSLRRTKKRARSAITPAHARRALPTTPWTVLQMTHTRATLSGSWQT
jgi:hypothetical protein